MIDVFKILNDHCKSEGKKLVDIRKQLLVLALDLYKIDLLDTSWEDYDREDQRYKDLSEFHNKIVQEVIDFIKENPGIKKMIESKRKEITKMIKEESGEDYIPDLRVSFGVDGLDDSIEFGEWVPTTDSCISIHLGNVRVIENM